MDSVASTRGSAYRVSTHNARWHLRAMPIPLHQIPQRLQTLRKRNGSRDRERVRDVVRSNWYRDRPHTNLPGRGTLHAIARLRRRAEP